MDNIQIQSFAEGAASSKKIVYTKVLTSGGETKKSTLSNMSKVSNTFGISNRSRHAPYLKFETTHGAKPCSWPKAWAASFEIV